MYDGSDDQSAIVQAGPCGRSARGHRSVGTPPGTGRRRYRLPAGNYL